jgi:hypothetical protein
LGTSAKKQTFHTHFFNRILEQFSEIFPTYFFQDDAKNDIVGVGIFLAGTWLKLERMIHNRIQQFIRLLGIIHPERRCRIRRGIVCGVGKPVGMAKVRSYWCIICLSKHGVVFNQQTNSILRWEFNQIRSNWLNSSTYVR